MIKVKKVSNKFECFATKQYIIPVFIILVIVLIFMEKGPFGTAKLRELSGGEGMLDMQFGYSIFHVYSMLDLIGAAGHHLYIKLLYLDFVFMVVYTIFQTLAITSLVKKLGLNETYKILNLLPFLRSILDATENCFILTIIFKYPMEVGILVNISSVITTSKLVLNIIIIALIFLLGALVTKQNLLSKI